MFFFCFIPNIAFLIFNFSNKELIYPSKIERIIPPWQNHVMHTLPLFAAVLDNFFTEHYYNRSFLKGFFPTFVLSIAYTAWLVGYLVNLFEPSKLISYLLYSLSRFYRIYIIAHFGGFWVYPILRVNDFLIIEFHNKALNIKSFYLGINACESWSIRDHFVPLHFLLVQGW